jgi:hypothetical protein
MDRDHIIETTLSRPRAISCADGLADAVLLFGPLYYLTDYNEWLRAIREARRVDQ